MSATVWYPLPFRISQELFDVYSNPGVSIMNLVRGLDDEDQRFVGPSDIQPEGELDDDSDEDEEEEDGDFFEDDDEDEDDDLLEDDEDEDDELDPDSDQPLKESDVKPS